MRFKMPIMKGSKVKVDYEGRFESGEIFDTSKHGDHSRPLEFEVGSGQVIPGFDEAVIGMEIGEEKEIVIKPEEAYGFVKQELFQKIPKSQLPPIPDGQEVKPGMVLKIVQDDRTHQIPVKDVDADSITLDLNHPLAGKTLIFKITIIDYSDTGEQISKENKTKSNKKVQTSEEGKETNKE